MVNGGSKWGAWAFTEDLRARGDVAASMAAVQCETRGDAMSAIKAPEELARAGISEAKRAAVRAMLQALGVKKWTDVKLKAHRLELRELVRGRACAARELLDAYASPDHEIASLAVYSSKTIFNCSSTTSRLMEAGLADALVGALSHSSPYPRSLATAAITGSSSLPAYVGVLQYAGLVNALTACVLHAPPRSLPAPCFLCGGTVPLAVLYGSVEYDQLDRDQVQREQVPLADAALVACLALDSLAKSHPSIATELAEGNSPEVLMHALRQPGMQMAKAAASLLCTVQSVMLTSRAAFSTTLAKAGFFALVPSLIRPADPELAMHVFIAMTNLLWELQQLDTPTCELLLPCDVEAITLALVDFIEAEATNIWYAGRACVLMVMLSDTAGGYGTCIDCQRSAQLITKVSWAVPRADWAAWYVLLFVLDQITRDTSESGQALAAAARGGFVYGVMNMLHKCRISMGNRRSTFPTGSLRSLYDIEYALGNSPVDALEKREDASKGTLSPYQRVLWVTTLRILEEGVETLTNRAIRAQDRLRMFLLEELRECCYSDRTLRSHTFVLDVCGHLLRFEPPEKVMRKEGLPSILIHLAHSPHPQVIAKYGEMFAAWYWSGAITCPHMAHLMAELAAAGVVEKLGLTDISAADVMSRVENTLDKRGLRKTRHDIVAILESFAAKQAASSSGPNPDAGDREVEMPFVFDVQK